MSKFDQKSPKECVPNGYKVSHYAIRWFKCKLKPPNNFNFGHILRCYIFWVDDDLTIFNLLGKPLMGVCLI